MEAPIVFVIHFHWDHPRVCTGVPSDQLLTCIESTGVSLPENSRLIVAVKGKLVNPELSLSACGVTDGSKVVAAAQKLTRAPVTRMFLRKLLNARARRHAEIEAEERMEPRMRVLARLADLSFNSVEMVGRFPILMEAQIAALEQQQTSERGVPTTIVDFEPKISEAPLPLVL